MTELNEAGRPMWRFTYTFTTSELIEYLRQMRKGTFVSMAGYMLKREVFLQAQEKGLIKLPENVDPAEAHMIPFDQVTIINQDIYKDE